MISAQRLRSGWACTLRLPAAPLKSSSAAHLHRKAAHAAGAAVHHYPLAAQRHAALQRLPGGQPRHGHRRSILQAHAWWHSAERVLIHCHVLSIRACT